MFYGTCKDRKVMYETRDGVFYLIPNKEVSYIRKKENEKEFLSYIKKTGKERCVTSFLHLFRGDKMSDERFFASWNNISGHYAHFSKP